ncbi:mannose-P-dolichol utilization defect 1 protein [Dacryopinax primogenitus]|uniref:Mannose-P-dolichol utilization defect 1 protein homolog n=1 Tax=Dacryopinax primogenitus (strain DJM 731) TaxID=1858805 RepID=M5FPV5_DACPD|nr:mannose-P-dolichol utilization defect 1 protein [Dacryopinax primogenitus]EJT98805.1 mannose-P-dolichol utilization defect 1 protein [Dacryopinax primogenitus]
MSITKRLIPGFLRDRAVALIGEECYVSLVENLNIFDTKCLKYAISKGLGVGLVLGGLIMKLPQLIVILRARSARGVSLTAYGFETLSYGIITAYSARQAYPFSTYGENFFLGIQNVVITLLIVYFAPRSTPTQLAGAAVAIAVGAYLLLTIPMSYLAMLQGSTIPLTFLSKVPQIISNHRLQSTGTLSSFAVFAAVAGTFARLFTTATEVKDPLVFWSYVGAAVLNVIIGVQMAMYWRSDERPSIPKYREDQKYPVAHELPQTAPIGTPTSPGKIDPAGSHNGSGRRWTRKLD